MCDDRSVTAELNDELRQYPLGGGTLVSAKIAAFDIPRLKRLVEALARFDGYCQEVDQSGEHAMGFFDFEAVTVVFKIEARALSTDGLGSRSAERELTDRVMTIMLAEEYVLATTTGRWSEG
jgi:hypothetical protein